MLFVHSFEQRLVLLQENSSRDYHFYTYTDLWNMHLSASSRLGQEAWMKVQLRKYKLQQL